MRLVGFTIGILIAAIGGVIAYRALFLEPRSAILVTETAVREFPNTLRVGLGIALLIVGAGLAFFAARKRG